jgi:hypothetical protein
MQKQSTFSQGVEINKTYCLSKKLKKATSLNERIAFFNNITKNEPLRWHRTFFKVAAISLFLFCAALFPDSAKAVSYDSFYSFDWANKFSMTGFQPRIEIWKYNYSPIACQNSVLLAVFNSQFQNDFEYIKWNGKNLTYINSGQVFGYNPANSFYIINPDIGNNELEIKLNTGNQAYGELIFLCDVDQTNPISTSSFPFTYGTGATASMSLGVPVNTGVVSYVSSIDNPFTSSAQSFFGYVLDEGSVGNISTAFHFVDLPVSENFTFSRSASGVYDSGYVFLNGVGGTAPVSTVNFSVAQNWFCCYGSCGYPISMSAQLGWWGVGATTTREIKWGLDGDPITNSIDFTNITNYLVTIPATTTTGYHIFRYEIYINGSLVSSNAANIQIVAGAACANTDPDYFNAFCQFPCLGLATSSDLFNLDNFRCGLQQFGCWLAKPTPESISYVLGQFGGLTANFPIAPFTKLYENLNMAASGTQAITPGEIAIPIYSTSTKHYEVMSASLGSSTALTSDGFQHFRRFETILIYCLIAAAPIIFILWRLIMPI